MVHCGVKGAASLGSKEDTRHTEGGASSSSGPDAPPAGQESHTVGGASGSGGPIAAAAPVKKSGMAGMVDDLKAEVAALKAQLAEKDAEIAALKAGAGSAAPAPEPAADDDDEPAE